MTQENKNVLTVGLGLAGNVAGIMTAVKRKSGFWGGLGWFIVGGIAGTAAGYVITSFVPTTTSTPVITNDAAKNATADTVTS